MASPIDFWNTGEDGIWNMDASSDWAGQTFQASASYTLYSVKLMMQREASPGTITCELYAVDGGTGKPDVAGGILDSGTTDGDTLPDSGGEWREILMGGSYSISSGTDYAIVVHCDTADLSNYFGWYSNSSGGYANGQDHLSSNSGTTWGTLNADFMFETYQPPGPQPPTKVPVDIVTVRRMVAIANKQLWYEDI